MLTNRERFPLARMEVLKQLAKCNEDMVKLLQKEVECIVSFMLAVGNSTAQLAVREESFAHCKSSMKEIFQRQADCSKTLHEKEIRAENELERLNAQEAELIVVYKELERGNQAGCSTSTSLEIFS